MKWCKNKRFGHPFNYGAKRSINLMKNILNKFYLFIIKDIVGSVGTL